MRIENGFTVLEPTDNGLIIEQALGHSSRILRQLMGRDQADNWNHRVQKARGQIQDSFGIVEGRVWFPKEEDVQTFIKPEELAAAVEVYGQQQLEQNGGAAGAEEVIASRGVLQQIEQLKAAQEQTPIS